MKKLLFLALVMHFNSIFCFNSAAVFSMFPNKYFIETGTYVGDGIQTALDVKKFEIIYSIELNPALFKIASSRFKKHRNVKIFLGDSSEKLTSIISSINQPITFWLDGHYSGGTTSKGNTFSPIMNELNSIKAHHIKTHTILIDDVRDFGTVAFDFITQKQIEDKIKEINPAYKIKYLDCAAAPGDILVAYIE